MKKIRFYIFIFLTKSYVPLAINILIYLAIRILFIEVVHAEGWGWNIGSFLLSEPDEQKKPSEKDEGAISYPEPIKYVANMLLSETIYDGTKSDTDSDTTSASGSDSDSDNNFVNPLTQINYSNILNDFENMINTCQNKREFIVNAIAFVGQTLPPELWAINSDDIQDDDSFVIQFIKELSIRMDFGKASEEEQLIYHLYVATTYCYNVAHLLHALENAAALEAVYATTLQGILGESLSTTILNGFDNR